MHPKTLIQNAALLIMAGAGPVTPFTIPVGGKPPLHTAMELGVDRSTNRMQPALGMVSTTFPESELYFANRVAPKPKENFENVESSMPLPPTEVRPAKKSPAAKPHGKEGDFSPAVLVIKNVLGDEQKFNKLRAKVISMHADVIESFVDTADTTSGQAVLKTLFELSDRNKNGTIELSELEQSLRALGFDFLKEKQIRGIFERADKDQNGNISLDEWLAEAPKTLRTNLIKLAKKNGGDMGLLA